MKKSILAIFICKAIKKELPNTLRVSTMRLTQSASDLGHVLGSPLFAWPKVIGEV